MWSQRQSFRVLAVMVFSAAVFSIRLPALFGGTINWHAASSGTFSVGTNWSGSAVPGASDAAWFNVAGAYTVTFNSSPTNQNVYVPQGNVTFQSSGGTQTYSLTEAGFSPVYVFGGNLTLGTAGNPLNLSAPSGWLQVDSGGSLYVKYGSHVTANSGLWLGEYAGGPGSYVTVDGAGSWLNTAGGAYIGGNDAGGSLTFQNSATGSIAGATDMAIDGVANSAGQLNVVSGASLTVATLYFGTGGQSGQAGTVTVSGAGSRITQTGAVNTTLGASANSTGLLNVALQRHVHHRHGADDPQQDRHGQRQQRHAERQWQRLRFPAAQ